ncbi:hypothetical protein CDL12_08220 [Handroanthus impetiginosus]|uniref:Uncharacterized protein n=1 Tax=Handroanthus impetiginosus TaxID=429701 RepID=A0A2G9HNK9_9LAMI|nr:hypothetical protein CDL12_08220 [Handroanthus impetiginosus]
MCSAVSKKQPNSTNPEAAQEENELQEQENPVTSHLYLKPAHTTGTLDKTVVLRRIRHRKRVNKVKSAVQALFSSPFTSVKTDDKKTSSVGQIRWADDAFAAP